MGCTVNLLGKVLAVAFNPEARRVAWATYKAYREAQRRQAPLTARTKAGGVLFIGPSIDTPGAWDVDVNPMRTRTRQAATEFNAVWIFAELRGTFYTYGDALDCAHREGIDWSTVQYG